MSQNTDNIINTTNIFDISKIITDKNLILYLVIINIIGFFVMWLDKNKAKKGKWRIPEKTLFIITGMGGGIGTTAGMYVFRHKTQKIGFVIGFPLITLLEIIAIVWFRFFA